VRRCSPPHPTMTPSSAGAVKRNSESRSPLLRTYHKLADLEQQRDRNRAATSTPPPGPT
jgi:hypothetical protein